MKHHIFYIQSGIAMAIALKSIDQLGFEKEKCIFICGRKMSGPEGFESVSLDEWSFKTTFLFPVGWKKSIQIKNKIHKFLKDKGVVNFEIYTTSFAIWAFHVLSKHKSCQKIWAIEEGRASYYSEDEFKRYVKKFHYSSPRYFIFQVKSWFNYLFQHYPNPNQTIKLLKKYNSALVLSNDSYSYIDHRIIIENPFKSGGQDYSHIDCLMAFSYPVEDNLISIDKYAEVLENTFEFILKKGINKVHYKFHPQQMSVEKFLKRYRQVQEKFSSQIEFIELPSNTILEVVMANSNAILLSDYSSLMIYTSTFGNKQYSNFNLLAEAEPSVKDKLGILPQILLDLMDNNKMH